MIEITHHWHLEKMLKLATHEAMKDGADVASNSKGHGRGFPGTYNCDRHQRMQQDG